MTCIVGYVDEKKNVWMGGDSAAVSCSQLFVTIRKDPKVFIKGDFVMGYTTSFRMGDVLQYRFSPPPMNPATQTVEEYMRTTFIDDLRDCFKSYGFAQTHDSQEEGGNFLVGFQGRLFEVCDDYQVGECVDGFASCGCGYCYALSALDAMDPKLSPKKKIEKALEIAVKYSIGVRPPFTILELKNNV